ncbi:thioredoxin family protein [Elioraea thermophila]|uniref:thioredoxin family protein n=1 Tax=Elioraea thermophila TaxID=2185104 RepID=UPI000DF3FA3E|nr:thioredoxin family protein [Elioraea thermophila]
MRIGRRHLLAGLAAVAAEPAWAEGGASLVMLERHDCPYCRRWLREVGPGWDASDLGRRAPLRRVDIGRGPLPPDLAFLRGAVFTPTFVLVKDGRELGRIVGYQGEALFWQAAEALVAKLNERTEEARQ